MLARTGDECFGKDSEMPSWLPRRDADRLIWLNNLALKLPDWVGTAGVVAGDVTFVNNCAAAYAWILARGEQMKTELQNITNYKTVLADGPVGTPLGAYPTAPTYPIPPATVMTADIFGQIVNLAERIKRTVGYTTTMGEDLGIENPVPDPGDPLTAQPTGRATALPGSQIQLDWVKAGFTGVVVESQRGAETGWTLLGTDFFAPYVDNRAPLVAGQPEVRKYRLRYLDGDSPVGLYSDIIVVTTIP